MNENQKEELKVELENLKKLHVDLEKQMLNFDEVIPYERQTTARIFSPRLLNMMLACCPQIESFSKLIAKRCNIDTGTNNIPRLIHEINSKAVLSNLEITTRSDNILFTPFTKDLEWWKNYNSLKHDLAINQFNITYVVVMNAFAALAALSYLASTAVNAFDETISSILDHKNWSKPIQVVLYDDMEGHARSKITWQSLIFKISNYHRGY